MKCKRCDCWFVSQSDLESHMKVCLTLQTQRNKWNKSRNPDIETIHKNKVPEIVQALREGHQPLQGFKCWVFNDLVCRRSARGI